MEHRTASLAPVQRRWLLGAGLALLACSPEAGADGPTTLLRQVPTATTNRALSFDGIGDYATTGTAQFPSGHAAQTVSLWFEVRTLSGTLALITLRKDEDSGVELALSNGLLTAYRVFGHRTLLAAPKAVTTGKWHHAAYTYDGTTNQLFLDGARVAQNTSLPDERTPTTCWLGTLDGTSDLFSGTLDDFRVFNTVRSDQQISDEAAGNFSSQSAGLVLYLPCNEDVGDLLYDHSPFANDGLLGDGFAPYRPSRVDSDTPADL